MTEQKDKQVAVLPEELTSLRPQAVDTVETAAVTTQTEVGIEHGSVAVADTTKSNPDPRFVDPQGNARNTQVSVTDTVETHANHPEGLPAADVSKISTSRLTEETSTTSAAEPKTDER